MHIRKYSYQLSNNNRSYSGKSVLSRISALCMSVLVLTVSSTISGCTLRTDRLPMISDKTAPGPVTAYIRASEPVPEADISAASEAKPKRNPYPGLSVPTYLNKVGDTYFLVDCYHDQVIFHDNLEDPLDEWSVMTEEIDKGHTIASDGEVYLIDDTEQNRILIFEKQVIFISIPRPFRR